MPACLVGRSDTVEGDCQPATVDAEAGGQMSPAQARAFAAVLL
jgi:hypothetical protein